MADHPYPFHAPFVDDRLCLDPIPVHPSDQSNDPPVLSRGSRDLMSMSLLHARGGKI